MAINVFIGNDKSEKTFVPYLAAGIEPALNASQKQKLRFAKFHHPG